MIPPIGYDGRQLPPFGYDESGRPRGPRCPSCHEHMTAGAFGYSERTGETVDWAECETCSIGWGPFTGFVPLDDEDDRDPGGLTR